jgi:hypothetical protein
VVKTYAEIVDELEAKAAKVKRLGDAPGDAALGFGLNGALTVGAKVDLARTEGLAGVFFWEAGQDKLGHRHSLLAAAAAFSGVGSGVSEGGTAVQPGSAGAEARASEL